MTSAEPKIILYDIPTKDDKPWSPNTWKTRMALNYKRIPFTTEWVEYPDIAGKLQGLLIPANTTGTPYTCPAITVTSSSSPPLHIMESTAIATYLDETYPSRPLYTGSTASRAAQKEIEKLAAKNLINSFPNYFLPNLAANLNPGSGVYFRNKIEKYHGFPLEDYLKEDRVLKEWIEVEGWLKELADAIEKAQDEGLEVLKAKGEDGTEEITYCALKMAGMLVWAEMFGPPEAWLRIKESQGGLWGNLYEASRPFM